MQTQAQRVYVEALPQFLKLHFIENSAIEEFYIQGNAVFQIGEYSIYIQQEKKEDANVTGFVSFYKDGDTLRIIFKNGSLSTKSDIDLFLDYVSVFIEKIKEGV